MTPSLRTTASTLSAMKAAAPSWRVPRLRLKPAGPATGYVDGAWWPYTRELAVELPALLAMLAARLDRIERVAYHLAAWTPAQRRLTVDGSPIRLEGFRAHHADTVTVTGGRGLHRLALLVVPPETEPADAHRILATAAHRGNLDTVETLLAAHGKTDNDAAAEDDAMNDATQRWDVDGGRIRTLA
ncbi:DUF5994 family protein [Amycolatopsis halotolerans]|uniref:DUF5994 family protein n=2 Tax=Amycolatopsis halotolerans TaxID=330083 RepID=A0ABV7QDR4_9PSEU